jgi:uncharacterized protein involved in exopolysaccharide biosynthesis
MGEANKMGPEQSLPRPLPEGGDVIDFGAIFVGLWAKKGWIIGAALAFTAAGAAYALLARPVYYAEAIIAPKSAGGDSRQGMLSQLGGLGIVAAQLTGGNNNLDHLEVMLKSKGLAEMVIRSNDLLPRLLAEGSVRPPDSLEGKAASPSPGMRDGIDLLTEGMLQVRSDAKKQVITVGIESRDPGFAAKLVEMYLAVFNKKLQSDIRSDADSNIRYLDSQLSKVSDPLLGEKIQGLIAGQLEKSMLMNSNSFDILERPFMPMVPVRPRRAMIVLMAFFSGLALSSFGVFLLQAFRGGFPGPTGRTAAARPGGTASARAGT